MKRSVKIAIIIFGLALAGFAQENSVSEADRSLKLMQTELLAFLTGKSPVMVDITNESSRVLKKGSLGKLSDRHSVLSRNITAGVLFKALDEIDLEPKRHRYETEKGKGTNVYATIPATTPTKEYVLLGAHYDSVKGSPGANDNASGTVLVYGVAAQLAKLKSRNRNFILVFFDQEEIGLVGSRAFAAKLKKDGMSLHSAHTVDQMGWDNDGDKAIEIELPTVALEKLYREEAEKLSITVHKTNVPSTDHTAFREIGFNAIGVTEEYKNRDTTPHYHKSSDTFETIDFDYLASTTRLVFNVMKRLAED